MHKEQNWILSFSVYLSLIALTALAVNRLNWSLSFEVFLEIAVSLLVLELLFMFRPLREFVLRLPRPHLFVLLAVVFCMYVGQFIPAPRTTFPFVPWQMFTDPIKGPDINYYEYWGNGGDGNRVRILPGKIFTSLGDGRIGAGLRHRLEDILAAQAKPQPKVEEPTDPSKDSHETPPWKKAIKELGITTRALVVDEYETRFDLDEKRRQYNNILIALGKMYNRTHAQQPVNSLEIFRCARALTDKEGDPERCQSVWRVDL